MAVLCDKEEIRFYKYDSSGKPYTNPPPVAKNIGLISELEATKTTNIQALLNLRYGTLLLNSSLKPSFGSVLRMILYGYHQSLSAFCSGRSRKRPQFGISRGKL